MVLNEQQEKEIKKHTENIEKMGKYELEAFAQRWHQAKDDLDTSVFKWILKTIDAKLIEIRKNQKVSHEVVASELRAGEL